MNVTRLGDGHPVVSVVACVHGDETSGATAIERFLDDPPEVHEPVQFVVANEEAMAEGTRAVDTDLNRAFPGDRESDEHEVALAPEVLKQVRDTKVLDIHSTNSTRRPFTVGVHFTMETAHLMRATGLDTVVDTTEVPNSSGGLISNCPGVSVECGHKETPETVETAHEIVLNFLAANGVVDAPYDYPADPQVYRVFEKIDHPTEASTLHASDFSLVRAGDRYLTVDGDDVTASQDFYPVLASDAEDSYPFVGFKAKNTGTVSDTLF